MSWSSDSGATNVEDHEESEGAHTFDGADLGASRPRVLLADDNADMRTHVGSLLYKAGYEVSAVADGEQALAACFAKPPDLVLTDAMMPKLDGFGLVTRLRSDERTALLPIILLSARAGEEARIDGLKTGADDYIVKPFGSRELLARVDAAVRLSRARREAMIREAEMARLRASFDDAAVGMAHVATDGRWLRVNDRLCAMIGYSLSELLGTTFQHITHPDDLATDLVWVNKLLAGEIATYAMEKRYLHKDGEIVWIILTVSLVRNADGTPDYFLSVIDDITARKRADIDLAESRSRLAGVVDSAMDAIITIDARQNVVLFNGAAERLFLRTAAEVVGQPLSLLLPQGFGDAHSQHINAFARTGVSNRTMGRPGPLAALRADGTEFPIEASISQTIVGGEKLFTSILRDITERKRAEDTQRLLLAELDHRVKNTLANVQAIAMQTLSATADPVTFVESFNGRIRALGRAHTLLTRSSWQGADLATLIKDQLTVDAGDAGNRISCIGPQVQLEPQTALHLGLVLHELGTNARKHGSLSRSRGSLATVWSVTADGGLPELRLRWVESDGPLVVAPAKRGFGSILIERSLQHALGGDARLDFAPSGVICEIRLPLAQREKGAYGGKLTEDSA